MSECRLKNVFIRSLNSGGSCRSAKLNYLVSGVSPDGDDPGADALLLARNSAPQELDGAFLSKVTLIKNHGSGLFEVQAEYEQPVSDRQGKKRLGDRTWIFDTTGGQEYVIHGKLLSSGAAPGEGAPPDPGTLINWNGKNGERFHVGGVQKIVPSMRECCIAIFRSSAIDGNFRRTLMELTGHVNEKKFHSWEPGEVLFLGASSGSPFRNDQGISLVEVTYRFAIRKNVANLNVAGVSLGKAEGWDIPWSIMHPVINGRTPTAAGVYLSSIYEKGDFSQLNL